MHEGACGGDHACPDGRNQRGCLPPRPVVFDLGPELRLAPLCQHEHRFCVHLGLLVSPPVPPLVAGERTIGTRPTAIMRRGRGKDIGQEADFSGVLDDDESPHRVESSRGVRRRG